MRRYLPLLLVILSLTASLARPADIGKWAPLQELLTIRKANLAKINTWQGGAEIDETVTGDGAVIESRKATASFKLNLRHDTVKWTWTYTSLNGIIDGKLQPDSGLLALFDHVVSVKTPTEFIRYDPQSPPINGQSVVRGVEIFPAGDSRAAIQGFAECFDPRWYFSRYGLDLDDYLAVLVQANDQEVKVSRQNDLVLLDVPNSRGALSHFVFSLVMGGNLVSDTGDAVDGTQVTGTWAFRKVSDVWLPSQFDYSKVDRGGAQTRKRRVVFGDQYVNPEIPDAEFKITGLGVAPGAPVSDNRLGVQYPFGAEIDQASVDAAMRTAATGTDHPPGPVKTPSSAGSEPEPGPVPSTTASRRGIQYAAIVCAVGIAAGAVVIVLRRKA